jgi:uncharacterized protein DUF4156
MTGVRHAACIAALFGLASCSFIETHQGAENVRVVNQYEVDRCDLLGKTTVSTMVRFRNPDRVQEDLVQLAKNSAVGMKGDTIVRGEEPHPGERTFSVYRCLR